MLDKIIVVGAKEHNLQNVSVEIPRNQFVVLTGVSGSGKSSLAFDTIYAEGQRRYVESLSTHAKQFFNQMNKPDVEMIDGLSPSISIQQRVSIGSPRSTVGTQTEIYDYMRVLFSKVGIPYCPKCDNVPIQAQSLQQMVDHLLHQFNGKDTQILSPVIKAKKGSFDTVLKELKKNGFLKARIDGTLVEIDDKIDLKKNLTHDIEVLIDQLLIQEDERKRISDSLRLALEVGKGTFIASHQKEEVLFSELAACPHCGFSFPDIHPGLFSFNSPYGACETCHGLGVMEQMDADLLINDDFLSLNEGCIPLITHEDTAMLKTNRMILESLADKFKFSLDKPWYDISEDVKHLFFHGQPDLILKHKVITGGRIKLQEIAFTGFLNIYYDRYLNATQNITKDLIHKYMSPGPCIHCKGLRLKEESLAIKINHLNIAEICQISIEKLITFFEELKLSPYHENIAHDLKKEISARLKFMVDVGLGYLTLSRGSNTLAGGEAQRIKLATQIGSGLMGVLYVLDEPSIGLHSRDTERLLNSLQKLKDIGNSVLVVEHDEATMRMAEHIIEMGEGAGLHGGKIIFQGSLPELMQHGNTLTAKYLRREIVMPMPEKRRAMNTSKAISLTGCKENNLKNISVSVPISGLITVTGVSGCGKSSLVNKTLLRALQQKLTRAKVHPGQFEQISGYDSLEFVIEISQSPIGRTPRSNPATYTGLFDLIRDWYANLTEAKIRGFKPSHFSFNVRGGRCETCSGEGTRKIEMHFLPDLYVPCEVCKGKRYIPEVLEVKYRGKSISDVLDSTVEEALTYFKNIPGIHEKLVLLEEVGLSYIKLGQPATTLSGGEAQRIKLASELGNRTKGNAVYILDEPTTGLHFADTHNLLKVLQKLVDYGHTVIIIEHNMEVIYASDWVIDLGPEGGEKGGELIAEGSPEDIMACEQSYTGQFLKKHVEEHYAKYMHSVTGAK